MAVGLYVTTQDELTGCLPAACQFARAFGNELIVFVPATEESVLTRTIRTRLKALSSDDSGSAISMSCQPLGEEAPEVQLLSAAQTLEKLLIAHAADRSVDQARLAERAPCTTVRLMADERNDNWSRVNVVRDGQRHGSARRAAQRVCEFLPDSELRLHPYEPEYDASDLVLIGTLIDGSRDRDDIEEAERIRGENEPPPAVGVVLTGHSRLRRAYGAVENLVQRTVPQMDRQSRQQLTDDLQVLLVRDEKEVKGRIAQQALREERFDFVAMIGASAALASLGLVQDSAAVIIGAMLVAPLMTPILAASLSIVHSNRLLFRRGLFMIATGFLFAFGVSFLVGLVYPLVADVGTTREMSSRCGPSLMDFLIGAAGGGAAAYARTRGQLSSALAGAAIAAALVPPVATAGLHTAFAATTGITVAGGVTPPAHPIAAPLLLFGMNVVSIMLAGAVSMWSAGVRSYSFHARSRAWQRNVVLMLMLVAVASVLVANWIDVGAGTR